MSGRDGSKEKIQIEELKAFSSPLSISPLQREKKKNIFFYSNFKYFVLHSGNTLCTQLSVG